ncbi:putative metallophosphoesterase At3g03305 isoform X2 [Cryptomeria japonica]|nr:putative metallophosphoesterase At3g03305 isoform X2 [Cryptomeria japonica]
MKQDKDEWIEYHEAMKDTIAKSGLREEIFYDLRGNHDTFGVPLRNSHFDFFSQYSLSASVNRTGNVHSVTLQNNGWKHLFIGFDSALSVGLRGPTNLFGHPTDKLYSELATELSQWDTQQSDPVTKIVFGHFPLSFSEGTETGKRLEDLFSKHAISAYLCGHLHTKFGRNLQRHHSRLPRPSKTFNKYFQINAHDMTTSTDEKQLCGLNSLEEFWEWEMGDWRKSRIMRIIAIDKGHASFVDFDYEGILDNASTAMPTIIVPTFPLDSRMMQRISSLHMQQCRTNYIPSHESIRALVFSATPITSVQAKIYDSISGKLDVIMETKMEMEKHSDITNRGKLYSANWDWKRFIDSSPNRYWLQVEVFDISGKHTYSQIRPFSVNFKAAPLKWTWKEFLVLGCQWDLLYKLLLWLMIVSLLASLLLPKLLLLYTGNGNQFNRWTSATLNWKSLSNVLFKIPLWILIEASKINLIWWGQLLHLVYLIFFPWFYGQVLTEDYKTGYMTHKGWTVSIPELPFSQSGIGVPDVMVIILPHLYFVVFPLLWVVSAFAAERVACQMHYLLKSEKKELESPVRRINDAKNFDADVIPKLQINKSNPVPAKMDSINTDRCSHNHYAKGCAASCMHCGRWIRKALLGVCLVILFHHCMQSYTLIRAYGAKAILSSPGFVWPVPLLLTLAVWKTKDLNYI